MSRMSRWRKTNSLSPATDETRERPRNSLRSSANSSSSACVRVDAADRLDGAQPEDLSDHGRVLQQLFLVLRERVQPGGDDPLDRLRQLREIAPFEQDAGVLLGVERVASGPAEQRLLGLRVEQRPLEQRLDETGRVLVGERRERDREGVRLAAAPTRPAAAGARGERSRGRATERRSRARPAGRRTPATTRLPSADPRTRARAAAPRRGPRGSGARRLRPPPPRSALPPRLRRAGAGAARATAAPRRRNRAGRRCGRASPRPARACRSRGCPPLP